MNEKAFKVKENSCFANKYWNQKKEREKFEELGTNFFKKYFPEYTPEFYIDDVLSIKLDLTQKENFKYKDWLKKSRDSNGFFEFKQNSKANKLWQEEVCSLVDFNILTSMRFWYAGIIWVGSSTLFDYKGQIYGCLKSSENKPIQLSDDMEELKMSEYYHIIEEIEETK